MFIEEKFLEDPSSCIGLGVMPRRRSRVTVYSQENASSFCMMYYCFYFVQVAFDLSIYVKYILAIIVLALSITTSSTTVSSSESCLSNKESIWLLVTTMAARCLPRCIGFCVFLGYQQFCYVWHMVLRTHNTSMPSSSIIFIKLLVAIRECVKLIWMNLICVLYILLQCEVLVLGF